MRYLVAVLALVVLVGSLVFVKFKQISSLMAVGKAMEKAGPPPEAVGSAVSKRESWGGSLAAVGTITAIKGVSLSNEVAGIVKAIHFESGKTVRQGEVLVEIDSTVERSQVASIEARRELATLNVQRTRVLVESQTVAKAQLDNDESAVKTSTADLGALRAQIDRKVVRAPFAGRLGIRQVNLGQYLTPGTPLVTLEAIDSVFVDFTLPQQRIDSVAIGMPVHVVIQGAAGLTAEGTIAAIDSTVDSTTRTMKLRAKVPNKEEKLRPGMFANVSVVLPETGSVVVVPASAVVHASYGDSVFVIEPKKDDKGAPVVNDGKPVMVGRQQFVRTGEARGDFLAVLDGLDAGQEVVSAGAFKLRNGASVAVNNDVKPVPQLAPKPENR